MLDGASVRNFDWPVAVIIYTSFSDFKDKSLN